MATGRVGVVCTSPRPCLSILFQAVHDANHRPVRAGNHHEGACDDNKDAPGDHQAPFERFGLLACSPIIVKPHTAVGLETHKSTKQSTD